LEITIGKAQRGWLWARMQAPGCTERRELERLLGRAKAVLEHAKAELTKATAALDALVEAGVLPEKGLPVVSGYTLYRQEGRPSWSYPPAVKELEAQLKKRKQLAEQLGEATQKRGDPFWTIKEATPLKPDSPLLRNQEQL